MSDIIDLEPYDNEPAELEASEVVIEAVSPKVSTEAIEGGHRAMWTVTLERADGRQIMRESFGAFPDMTPPEPEPETEAEVSA